VQHRSSIGTKDGSGIRTNPDASLTSKQDLQPRLREVAMHGWMGGWDWFWMVFMMLFWIAILGAVVHAAVRLAQRAPRERHQ